MAGYATAAGYPQAEADRLLEDVDRAAASKELLILLPQFIVTATAHLPPTLNALSGGGA